ncbi:hypothetical protein O7627_11060 [Solwaraspora sp. WMMD1047]|uniref:hypothetical protein n=1 Tax=Solwaraspora sp. WMMD1047 TaxID=3016102 RepID=UPI002415B79D|nr:hypothetical protein [Solwaraspora sp. WMMD1047]MDG4829839.1 hypothetical protein [Solwaraspora sp. WMMD1047]
MSDVDVAEPPRARWLDRRRDLAWWLLTPLATLIVTPVLVCVATMAAPFVGDIDRPPTLCADALADNTCEETTLAMFGAHGVFFVVAWALLWLVPWWRGLRVPRLLLAVVAAGALVAVPFRMAG